jgi:hypothetical protein
MSRPNDPQTSAQSDILESENIPGQGLFARFEEKYFLPKENSDRFRSEVLKLLNPSYPAPGTRFTRIESVYFDSPDFAIYRMHFSSRQNRFKIRTRRYAPNGVPEPEAIHLELKSKSDGISRKSRFRIGPRELGFLQKGCSIRSIGRGLAARNGDITPVKLKERVEQINTLISQNQLQPSCVVRYRREAFEAMNLRLTIDDALEFEVTQSLLEAARLVLLSDPVMNTTAKKMLSNFHDGDYLLVEVKFLGKVPTQLTELLRESGCQKARFSKYCYSITSALSVADQTLKVA